MAGLAAESIGDGRLPRVDVRAIVDAGIARLGRFGELLGVPSLAVP